MKKQNINSKAAKILRHESEGLPKMKPSITALKLSEYEVMKLIQELEMQQQELKLQNKELIFQNDEKEKRAAELIVANKELAFQNDEKEKRAAELIVANKELAFQNNEKEKRAAELIIANKELAFQNDEKEKRAAELIIANKELAFQNNEKEKRANELIIAKEHAEESDNLKTSFLNNISHEIRTPFNGILGFLSLIQEEDLAGSERDEYISIINKSAYRLMNTINDIVEISQIQAQQMKLTESEINIRKLTSGVYNHFKTDAENKGLKFYINYDLTHNIEYVFTDGIKLNTILTILIGNAIKFTKTGSIEFGIKCRDKASLVSAPVEIEFSVKDTGVGISKTKQQTIFERFMQADSSNTRRFEGSGLGLSIAKAYIEMLGGEIWIESEEGKGSVFYFTIPYNVKLEEKEVIKNAVSTEGIENKINPKGSGLKILIVEDDEGSAKFLTLVIKKFSKEVLNVKTGVEAVEACRNNPDIDLVLMDIKMPEMDGYEATRQIRKFNNDVLIIAQTAFALPGDRKKAIAAGCNDYIAKPYGKSLLKSLLEKHFQNRTIINSKNMNLTVQKK